MAAVVLAGCESVVEIAPPDHTPKLVADAFFTADSSWVARVSTSVPYAGRLEPTMVTNAIVTVESENGRVQELSPAQPGLYAASGLGAKANAVYRLRVRADGYAATEGTARLPDPANVAVFRQEVNVRSSGLRQVDVTIVLDDPAQEPNYYGLFVVRSRWKVDLANGAAVSSTPSFATFESSDDVLNDSPLGVLDREVQRHRHAFFDDELFNGTRCEITFRLDMVKANLTTPNPAISSYAVILIAASEELYRYWTSADQQRIDGENPFAEPIRIYSNMSTGLGVFAGFRYDVLPIPPDAAGYQSLCDLLPQTSPCSHAGFKRSEVGMSMTSHFLGASITR